MILVTGGKGQLGQCLNSLNSSQPIQFLGSKDLDITDIEQVNTIVTELKPTYIINCAAYTQVDKAETEVELANLINIRGAKNLAISAKENNVTLIHISTDYVFNGNSPTPYKESDSCNPLGVYGNSKHQGELEITKNCDKNLIIRTSWLYSEFANNFVKSILSHMRNKDQLGIVFDQVGSPTYAKELAKFILYAIENNLVKNNYGVYHFANTGVASWYDLTKEIQSIKDIPCDISPIESKEYPTPAKRPAYSVFNTQKLRTHFNYQIPYWKESLQSCLQNL